MFFVTFVDKTIFKRANMVITILEARVESAKWSALADAFKTGIAHLDPGIAETSLIHGPADPTLWRIHTVWQSRAALDQMRQSGETPRGVRMFRAAGAEPTLSVFSVAMHSASMNYG